MLIGLLAFLCGMIAGYISLRALGWLCLACGLFLGGGLVYGGTQTITINYVNIPGGGATYRCYVNGLSCPVGGNPWTQIATGTLPAGSGTVNTSGSWGGSAPSQMFEFFCSGTYHNTGCQTYQGNVAYTADGSSCVAGGGGAAPSTYSVNGCITNVSATMQGYYVHASTPVEPCGGGVPAQDFYSGPLGPGQVYCICLTNSSPFQYWVQQILYNNDGGTNSWSLTPPRWAGTNSTPTTGDPITGAPGAPNTGTGTGGGAGNTTNLTGAQFNYGMSNLYNVQINIGNQLAGGIGQLHSDLGGMGDTLKQIQTNTSALGSNIDYTGYWRTLTNQMSTATNLLAANNPGNWTNAFSTNLDGAWGLYSNAIVTIAGVDSNYWVGGTAGNEGAYFNASNYPTVTPGVFNLWNLPLYSNTVAYNAGNVGLRFDPTSSNFFQDFAPWVKIVGYFCVSIFCTGYIFSRCQEEVTRIGTMVSGASGVLVFKVILNRVGTLLGISVAIGAFPIILAGAANYLATQSGGVPVSPFSNAGVSQAGAYSNAVVMGWLILNSLFPATFAIAALIYLFVFDNIVTAAVLAAARIMKMMNL